MSSPAVLSRCKCGRATAHIHYSSGHDLLVKLSLLMLLSIVLASSVGLVQVAVSDPPRTSAPCVCGPKQVNLLLFDAQDAKHSQANTLEKYEKIITEMNASVYRQSYEKMWLTDGLLMDWRESPYVLEVVMNAGPENVVILADYALESSQSANGYLFAVYAGDLWPISFPTKGVALIGENWGLSVYMHELGHLMGLPDIYKPEQIQQWDVMALVGSEDGQVSTTQAEFSAWSRLELGWLTTDDVIITQAAPRALLQINSLDELSGARVAIVPVSPPLPDTWWETKIGEYFLILEARSTTLVIYYYTGVEPINVAVDESQLETYNFTRLAVVQTLSLQGPSQVFVSELKQVDNFGVVLLDTQLHTTRIKLTSSTDAKKAEEALNAIQTASASQKGNLLKNNELNDAQQAFLAGNFEDAIGLAEKARLAPFLATWQLVTLVLLVACPVVALLLLYRRAKPRRGEAKITLPSTPNKALQDKFCRECGAKIPRDSKYCEKCGEKLA